MELLNCTRNQILKLTNEEFIGDFVSQFYSQDSYNQVHSKLSRHIIKGIGKHFSRFNFEDYQLIQNQNQISTDVKNYTNTLFKFLVLKEIVETEKFQGIFPVEKIKDHFENRVQVKDKIRTEIIEKYETLEFNELLKIEKFYDSETTEIDSLKRKFFWYILSEHDYRNKQIHSIKSEDFKNGQLYIGEEIIDLPNIFEDLFDKLSKLKNDGFTNMSGNLKELAEQIGINRNLTPTLIRNTKLVNTMRCPNCQENYSSHLKNWCAIEEKLVCKICGDLLRKKYSYQELNNSPVEKVDNYKIKESNELEFRSRKKKILNKGVDFSKLNEIFEEIGKLGEDFVYNIEYNKLIDTPYANFIDKTIADVQSNGYDILSYELDGTKLHIEVKTTTSKKDEFFISKNEINTAKQFIKNGEKYYVYFVKDILSEIPELIVIENILDDIKYSKVAENWKVEIT